MNNINGEVYKFLWPVIYILTSEWCGQCVSSILIVGFYRVIASFEAPHNCSVYEKSSDIQTCPTFFLKTSDIMSDINTEKNT